MEYKLEIKQIVTFPRCRIYREFIQNLIMDKNIRTNGCSYLFYFTVLCSLANYRTSQKKYEGISYTILGGEWILPISELQSMFRCKYQHQVHSALQFLQDQHYITYSTLGRKKLIKFQITNWKKDNTSLNYSYPCKKSEGFFFFPIAKVYELISIGKCSEIDIILDLWIHAIYNDNRILGSDIGPIVYFRNSTSNPITNYGDLAERWGISKSTTGRILKKLDKYDYISLVSFKGKIGSAIYLQGYLSTMFNISDVLIDKEEISLHLNMPLSIPAEIPQMPEDNTVPKDDFIVPESHMKFIVKKISELLDSQGLSCCHCRERKYQLSKLSDCNENLYSTYSLGLTCPFDDIRYQFVINICRDRTTIPKDKFNRIPSLSLNDIGGKYHDKYYSF